MPRFLIVSTLVLISCNIVWLLLMDWLLYLDAQPTITQYIRAFPAYYWYPVLVLSAFVIGLGIHLFG